MTKTRHMLALIVAASAVASVFVNTAFADGLNQNGAASGDSATKSQYDISAGYLDDLRSHGNSHGYYKLTYNDDVLSTEGTSFTTAQPSSPETAFGSAPNDSSPHVSLSNGSLTGSGGVLNLIGRHSLDVPALNGFLGTLEVDTPANFSSPVYRGGLESPRLPILDWVNDLPGIDHHANTWTYLGIFDEFSDQSTKSTQKSVDNELATYRTFLGKPLTWIANSVTVDPSDTLAEYDKDLKAKIKPGVPDSITLKDWWFSLNDEKTNGKLTTDTSSVDYAVWYQGGVYKGDLDDPAKFREDMALYFSSTPAAKEQPCPVVTLWCESKGFYQLTGHSMFATRFTNLMDVNLQYFVTPKSPASNWLMLTYQVGTDRAAPGAYNNFVAATLGFAL